MEPFWKGSFATFTKHLKSVALIPLAQMAQEGWDILDYQNLRPSARYNLEKQIISGNLYGFYKVSVDQHLGKTHSPHGGKEIYFYPAGREDFDGEGLPPDFNFDSGVDQDSIPDSPAGYLALSLTLRLFTPAEQWHLFSEIKAQNTDINNELRSGILSLRDENLILLAMIYILLKEWISKGQRQDAMLFLRKEIGLSEAEISKVLDEIGRA